MQYIVPRERDGSLSTSMVELRSDDGSSRFIPLVDGNADADAYRVWLAEGNAPDEAPAPAAAPEQQPISWMEFMGLFTLAEQTAVAVSTDPNVARFRLLATGLGGDMDFGDPQVALGLDALVAAGLLAESRKADVLARRAPV